MFQPRRSIMKSWRGNSPRKRIGRDWGNFSPKISQRSRDDGVFDRDQILANLDILTLTSYSPRDFKPKVIAPDTVLLIFQVTVSGTYKGHPFQADNNAASLWMKRSGMWQNVLFQETPIPSSAE